MKVTLVIPTLNEIDGMKEIMPRINRDWVNQIIVVDGGSVDGTIEYAKANSYFVLEQKTKGLVNAYREVLEVAIGDVIITFTPDGNSIPELIPSLIKKINEDYDMVIVSRYLNGAKSYDDDIVTAFGNWMFTKMINILFNSHYTDTLVGFRAWKKDLFESIDKLTEKAGFEPQIAIKCAKRKLKVSEIPGDEPKRIGGATKFCKIVNGYYVLLLIIRELFIRKYSITD